MFAFDLYDQDGSGNIDFAEVELMLKVRKRQLMLASDGTIQRRASLGVGAAFYSR